MKKKSVRLKYKDSVHAESVFFSTIITCWLPFSNFLTSCICTSFVPRQGLFILFCIVTSRAQSIAFSAKSTASSSANMSFSGCVPASHIVFFALIVT